MNRHGTAVVSLPSDLEIQITRIFDAPAALVFEAWTTPALIRRWWGYEQAPLVVCEMDLRVGGSWRYVTRDADGVELGWHGECREIDAPRRLVASEVFEPFPEAGAVNTLTLTEHPDGTTTTLVVNVVHQSRENRDGHVNSGMETGMQQTFDRLETLLGTTAPPVPKSIAERYRSVAGRFTATVASVPPDAWDNPAPCDGWVARDIVRHMVEWMPNFMHDAQGPDLPVGPPVDDDPLAAWTVLSDGLQGVLDDPGVSARTISHPFAGTFPLDQAIGMFFLGDVLIHTWDLARATGLDEHLDADEVAGMLAGLEPIDEMLRQSGQYGPRVPVPADADVQTKLIAFVGRRP
jgi:uncharacterized protein (TIGR03086 family)